MNNTKTAILKQELYRACEAFIQVRLHTIRETILELQQSLDAETKSSAGDKHETGRAMLQLEREKAGHQLAEIQKTNTVLAKINIENASEVIGLGSVVYTNKANYFIAISIGEISIKDTLYYAISPSTPIGQLLMGKTIGDAVVFREQKLKITNVM